MEVIGHRGARFEAPENTLEAFRHAISLGLTTVEFDVHTTSDGALVVIHDATVDRTTNGSGAVNEMTLEEIKSLDARSIHDWWPEPVRIPTLSEVLTTVRRVPNMEIEIKRDTERNLDHVVQGTITEIRAAGMTDSVVLTSFEPYALELAQKLAPEIRRGFIADFANPANWYLARKFEVFKVGINLRTATPEIVQQAKSLGYQPVAWPCNDEDAVRKVFACGFEEVCTDAPTIFAPLLRGEKR